MVNTPRMDNLQLNLEELLPHIGEYGRFQRLLIAMPFIMNIPAVSQVMIAYFSTLTPNWRCVLNSTICTFNGTLSPHDQRKCDIPVEEWYFTEPTEYSFVTQFDIYCKDEWLLHLTTSSFFIGWALGAIILGWTADKYGRKLVLFSSVTLKLLTGIISSFMPNIYLIIVCRFIIGFFYPGVFIESFVLISELLSTKHREGAGLYIFSVIPFSWCLLALKAYLTQNWKVLSLICTTPYLFVLLFYKFVPESLQWLEAHGKHDELMESFRRIAFWNKRDFPENIEFVSSANESRHKANPIEMFRTRRVALQSFTLIILWIVVNMVYYGLQLASNDLEGSIYRDFVILSLVSLVANISAIFLCKKIGRKRSVLLPALGGGIACLTIAFIPSNRGMDAVRVIIGFVGQLGDAISFCVLHACFAQLYTVTLRSEALGILTASSRLGGTASPWIVKGLKPFGYWLPFVVLAVPLMIGATIGIWLPEKYVSDETEINETTANGHGDSSDV